MIKDKNNNKNNVNKTKNDDKRTNNFWSVRITFST